MGYEFSADAIMRGSPEWREGQQLAAACQKADGDAPRLIAKERSYIVRDAEGAVIGYLGLTQMVPGEVELSGMVHPQHRRMGIFTSLLQMAAQDLTSIQAETLIFICGPRSKPGLQLLEALNAKYDHNEYRMESRYRPGITGSERLSLRQAKPSDGAELARQNSIYFGDSGEHAVNIAGVWLAEVCGCPVGKVEAKLNGNMAFIYGLGVLPEHRRQGYGREILLLTMDKMSSAGAHHFALEVASENASALGLYQSVGFEVMAEYGYYKLSRSALRSYLEARV